MDKDEAKACSAFDKVKPNDNSLTLIVGGTQFSITQATIDSFQSNFTLQCFNDSIRVTAI